MANIGVPNMSDRESNKINGFDKYEIEDAARTLITAQKITLDKRKGFYDTVKKELTKQVKAADEAAVVAKVAQKLSETFGSK